MSFELVKEFENKMATFFGAPYAIAVDCCTHGIELCLRYTKAGTISVPKRTYISVPFLANKIGLELEWREEDWVDYYFLTDRVIDAAVLWKKAKSTFDPDFCAVTLKDNPWIVQPFEKYEEIRIEELKKKNKK